MPIISVVNSFGLSVLFILNHCYTPTKDMSSLVSGVDSCVTIKGLLDCIHINFQHSYSGGENRQAHTHNFSSVKFPTMDMTYRVSKSRKIL